MEVMLQRLWLQLMGSEASDAVGLAKISNMTKDYLTVLLTSSALESENQVKKNKLKKQNIAHQQWS